MKTSLCYSILSLFVYTTSAFGFYSDQSVIKHESEVTGDLHKYSNTTEEFILYSKGVYLHHVHVLTPSKDTSLSFFENNTLPCSGPPVLKIDTGVFGDHNLNHRFNNGTCGKTTGIPSAELSIHYFIGG